jgi:hypothetical protein
MARLRRLAMARGGVAGADLGGVLGEGGVADVVQRLDIPVPAYVVGEVGGAGLGGGEAGDRVDRHGPPPPVVQEPDPAGDADRLDGVGEVQASDGGDLEPAELDPAVAAVTGVVLGGDVAPGQDLELLVQRGLVVLHDQHVGGMLDADQFQGDDHRVGPLRARANADAPPTSPHECVDGSARSSRSVPPSIRVASLTNARACPAALALEVWESRIPEKRRVAVLC